MKDAWKTADPYEYFMGRWSRLVARKFLQWLSPIHSLRWLDVGCGTGALSETVMQNYAPLELTAMDQSKAFVSTARKHLGSKVHCLVGNAIDLGMDDASVDLVVSGLVLNFISEPKKALVEMKRVTTTGGTIAAYVWDYAGKMDFLRHFWDSAVALNPEARNLDEGIRFPDCTPDALEKLFQNAGFENIKTTAIEIDTPFINFNDYWRPFLGGQGPAPTYVMSLKETERERLKASLQEHLPIQADGSITMIARAWAARGRVGSEEKWRGLKIDD